MKFITPNYTFLCGFTQPFSVGYVLIESTIERLTANEKNFSYMIPYLIIGEVVPFVQVFCFSMIRLYYFSYKNSSGNVTLKSFARCLKLSGVIVCSLSGLMDNILTRISADFSAVCIRPNVRSKSSPAANIP